MKIELSVNGRTRVVEHADPLFAFAEAHRTLVDMQEEHANAAAAEMRDQGVLLEETTPVAIAQTADIDDEESAS